MSDKTTTWGVGDYPAMARRLLPAALAAVSAAKIQPGDRVLDVAAGTGNAALLAGLCGARVTGVDWEPALLALARQQAYESAIDAQWLPGDAACLPVPDGSADVVLSVFGVMYAADQAAAAAELARVCAPAGRVVLTAWTPGSVMPAMGPVLAPYLPPLPPGSAAPSRWGDVDAVCGLLAAVGLPVTSAQRRHLRLRFADTPAATNLLVGSAGHLVAERPRLEAEQRWNTVLDDVSAFVAERGVTDQDGVSLALHYLLVTAQPR